MKNIKTAVLGVVAVLACGVVMTPSARANVLQFSYSDSSGLSFMFDQSSNPVPSSHDSNSTTVSVSHWSGNIGPYSSIIWYSASDGGMFDTPDHNYQIYGDQVYSGTLQAPVFTTGTFYSQYGSYCHSIKGKLIVTDLTVPEPGTFALFGAALLGLGVIGLRRRKNGQAA